MSCNPGNQLAEQLRLARELQASYTNKPQAPSGRGTGRGTASRFRPYRGNGGYQANRATYSGPSRTAGRAAGAAAFTGRPAVRNDTNSSDTVAPAFPTETVAHHLPTDTVVLGLPNDKDTPGWRTDKSPPDSPTDPLPDYPALIATAVENDPCKLADGSFSDPGNTQNHNFVSYPANGLASSSWAKPDENYRAPFPFKILVSTNTPSAAFLSGEDFIDLGTRMMVPFYRHADKPPSLEERKSEVTIVPSTCKTTEENIRPAPAPAPKPRKGLASSKWA